MLEYAGALDTRAVVGICVASAVINNTLKLASKKMNSCPLVRPRYDYRAPARRASLRGDSNLAVKERNIDDHPPSAPSTKKVLAVRLE